VGVAAECGDQLPPHEQLAEGRRVEAAPMMGGPFVSPGGTMAKAEPVARDESWNEENPKR
jgi:hypothetical protein